VNERIKLLISQAEIFANQTVPQLKGNQTYWWRVRDEKFAELIVKECIDIADQESKTQRSNYGRQAADQIWHTIKNRFGV